MKTVYVAGWKDEAADDDIWYCFGDFGAAKQFLLDEMRWQIGDNFTVSTGAAISELQEISSLETRWDHPPFFLFCAQEG